MALLTKFAAVFEIKQNKHLPTITQKTNEFLKKLAIFNINTFKNEKNIFTLKMSPMSQKRRMYLR